MSGFGTTADAAIVAGVVHFFKDYSTGIIDLERRWSFCNDLTLYMGVPSGGGGGGLHGGCRGGGEVAHVRFSYLFLFYFLLQKIVKNTATNPTPRIVIRVRPCCPGVVLYT